jgi:hypothetical protein
MSKTIYGCEFYLLGPLWAHSIKPSLNGLGVLHAMLENLENSKTQETKTTFALKTLEGKRNRIHL